MDATAGPRELLLLGSGGFGRETAEVVRAINEERPAWNLIGFLDDDPTRHGVIVGDMPIVGAMETVHARTDAYVVICTVRPDNYVSRERIAARLGLDTGRFATIVHPLASVSSTSRVGAGSVLLAHVALTANTVVGHHVAVMPHVVLTHDVVIGDFVTIAAGAKLGGSCRVGNSAFIASGATIREGITIGERAMIGMGSVVTRDVPPARMWFGAPARDMGPAPIPPAR